MKPWIRQNWWWLAGLLLAGYKLALLRSQHLQAVGNARHDAALFMRLAEHLVRGEWLGPYDQLTLAKGPAYSLFIAGNFYLSLPLGLTQQLLYLLACLLVVGALVPVMRVGWARLLVLVFLFYNPLSYEGVTMTTIMRQHLTMPLGLMIAAGVIGVTLRGDRPRAEQLAWAALAGLAAGVFWITREEGIWIVPLLLMGLLGIVVDCWRRGRAARLTVGLTILVFAGLVALPATVVSTLNARHYGWWGVVDFKAAAWQDLLGALSRVEAGPNRPHVLVNREAREAIYAVSPTFAELAHELEVGAVAQHWVTRDVYSYEERQYMTAWFMWALRDAIAATGQTDSPTALLDFCAQAAAEINAACDAGTLPAGPRRSGFLPRWHPSYGEAMRVEWWSYLNEAMAAQEFETIVPESIGTDDEVRAFVDLSWDQISPSAQANYFHKPHQVELKRVRMDRLRALGDTWRGPFRISFWVAWGLLLVRTGQLLRERCMTWPVWLALAVWATVLAELTLNFLVHIMAFNNRYPAAWAPAYPLMQLSVVLVAVDLARSWVTPVWTRVWRPPSAPTPGGR